MHAPFTRGTRRRLATAVLALAAAGLLAACGTASGSASGYHSTAAAAVSSALANPTISSDLNQAEQLLVANVQAHWDPAHPILSMQAAVRATFPKGDVKAIATYALRIFSLPVLTTSGPGSARDAWAEHVFDYAKQRGGATPSGSPSPAVTGSTA